MNLTNRNSNRRNRRNRQRGAAALEFGLAFLVFFSLVYAIMEYGRIVASYNILAGATREATRYAVVHGGASGAAATASDIQNVVRHWAIGLDSNSVLVTTTWSPGNGPGSHVRVHSSYTVQPFTGLILHNGLTLQSTSEMTISQ
jgi:Flp pilus assembly protein TadG